MISRKISMLATFVCMDWLSGYEVGLQIQTDDDDDEEEDDDK